MHILDLVIFFAAPLISTFNMIILYKKHFCESVCTEYICGNGKWTLVDILYHILCPGEENGCSLRNLVRIGYCRAED